MTGSIQLDFFYILIYAICSRSNLSRSLTKYSLEINVMNSAYKTGSKKDADKN